MKEPKVTEQELATARQRLALEILEAENAREIVYALQNLTVLQAKRADEYRGKKGKKGKGKFREWRRASDETYTVLMCAIYTKQDERQ